MDHETRFYLIALFDYYAPLLTDKQQQYFKSYYFNDFSLSEIASKYNISRAAVQESIKKIITDLKYYESKLELYNKASQRLKLYNNLTDSKIKDKLIELEQQGNKDEK